MRTTVESDYLKHEGPWEVLINHIRPYCLTKLTINSFSGERHPYVRNDLVRPRSPLRPLSQQASSRTRRTQPPGCAADYTCVIWSRCTLSLLLAAFIALGRTVRTSNRRSYDLDYRFSLHDLDQSRQACNILLILRG